MSLSRTFALRADYLEVSSDETASGMRPTAEWLVLKSTAVCLCLSDIFIVNL
jgi:hypothetical protein